MPIGFVCHGMHGADNRKVISSDIYECTDALILSGFRQCEWDTNSVSPQLHPTLIVGSVNSNSEYIFQWITCRNTANFIYKLYLLTLQAVRNLEPYQHHPQRSTFPPALRGIGVHVGQPYWGGFH